jgi:hypothetical protein
MSSILSLISCILVLAVLFFDFSSFLNVSPCFFASLINSGSAVSITEKDHLRTTQSKTTNLSAEHLFGDAVLFFDFSSFLNVSPCFFASLINMS